MPTVTPRPSTESTPSGSAPADIVERLRAMASDFASDLAWCDEAADTITELRVILLEEVAKRGHLMAETHELRQRIAELEQDAGRYRFLREYAVDSYIACGSHAALDAAIDAARKD